MESELDRASGLDMMELATDVGPVPMQVGAILVLDGETSLGASRVRAVLADRVRGIPRLRQRLVSVPLGCGRPVWIDDPGFNISRHVGEVSCPAPGDEPALLGMAADLVTRPLPSHASGGTVNDVALAAVSEALTELLAARGEHAESLVASVPVSGRAQASAAHLGNQVGVIPVPLPDGRAAQGPDR